MGRGALGANTTQDRRGKMLEGWDRTWGMLRRWGSFRNHSLSQQH